MLTMRKMTYADKKIVLGFVNEFYQTDAIAHPVSDEVKNRCFEAAIDQDSYLLGYLLCEEKKPVGFVYITCFYSCEVGGNVMMIEELFVGGECRGKGYGTECIQWLMDSFPHVKRFRLEVSNTNEKAIALYERIGFSFYHYDQMVLDRK